MKRLLSKERFNDPIQGTITIASSLTASLDESPFHMHGVLNLLETTILFVLHEQDTWKRAIDLVCATEKWAQIVSDINEHHTNVHLDSVILKGVAHIEAQRVDVQTRWFGLAQQALHLQGICEQTSISDFFARD